MAGKNQRTDTHEHYQCRKGDGPFVGCQHLAAIGIFLQAALCYKDGIVVSLPKDKCGQYNIYQIELYAQQSHNSKNPYPTDGHREESQQGQFEASERKPEKQKNNGGTGPTQVVEVVCQVASQFPVHAFYVEEESPFWQNRFYFFPHRFRVGALNCYGINHPIYSCQRVCADMCSVKVLHGSEISEVLPVVLSVDYIIEGSESVSAKACFRSLFCQLRPQQIGILADETLPKPDSPHLLVLRT